MYFVGLFLLLAYITLSVILNLIHFGAKIANVNIFLSNINMKITIFLLSRKCKPLQLFETSIITSNVPLI